MKNSCCKKIRYINRGAVVVFRTPKGSELHCVLDNWAGGNNRTLCGRHLKSGWVGDGTINVITCKHCQRKYDEIEQSGVIVKCVC
jgi:hypothetical protein